MVLLFVCYICNECPKFPLAYNCLAADSTKKKIRGGLKPYAELDTTLSG